MPVRLPQAAGCPLLGLPLRFPSLSFPFLFPFRSFPTGETGPGLPVPAPARSHLLESPRGPLPAGGVRAMSPKKYRTRRCRLMPDLCPIKQCLRAGRRSPRRVLRCCCRYHISTGLERQWVTHPRGPHWGTALGQLDSCIPSQGYFHVKGQRLHQRDASKLHAVVSWSQVVGRKGCWQLSGRNVIPRILLSA